MDDDEWDDEWDDLNSPGPGSVEPEVEETGGSNKGEAQATSKKINLNKYEKQLTLITTKSTANCTVNANCAKACDFHPDRFPSFSKSGPEVFLLANLPPKGKDKISVCVCLSAMSA